MSTRTHDGKIPDGLIFGYRYVSGVPNCPCNDPGNYLMMERKNGQDLLRCWCGRSCTVQFDDDEERSEFIRSQGG